MDNQSQQETSHRKHDTVRMDLKRNTMLPEEDIVSSLLSHPARWTPGRKIFDEGKPDEPVAMPLRLRLPAESGTRESAFHLPPPEPERRADKNEILSAAQALLATLHEAKKRT